MNCIEEAFLTYFYEKGALGCLADNFGRFSPSYTISNEHLSEAMEILKPRGKSVLTVAASGDQAFFYKINGASHIDTFDISYCAQVMMNIKTAAVQNLQYSEYTNFLNSIESASVNIPDLPIYNKISLGLSDDVKDFLKNMRGVQYRLNSSYNFNTFTARQYKKLKNGLNQPFNFIWSDVVNLSGKLTKKYDQVYLSNIFHYNYDAEKNVNMIQSLLPYLNDKAEIILYVTPFLRPHERDALNKVSECLKKYIDMRLEKTSNQQYVIVKKL